MIQFVLLSTQRTGSTYLRIWLNSHSKIDSHGEIFLSQYESQDGLKKFCENSGGYDRVRFTLHHSPLFRGLGINWVNRALLDRFLASLFTNPEHPAPWTNIDARSELLRKRSPEVTGFKVMYNTLEQYPRLREWILQTETLKVIHLVRKNLLKSFISGQRMQESRVAHTTDEGFRPAAVHVDLARMRRYFEDTLTQQRRYRDRLSTSHAYMELSYEQMFAEMQSVIARILDFLGMPYEEMRPPSMKKISSMKLADEVANPGQVIEDLSGTQFAAYLDDFEL